MEEQTLEIVWDVRLAAYKNVGMLALTSVGARAPVQLDLDITSKAMNIWRLRDAWHAHLGHTPLQ